MSYTGTIQNGVVVLPPEAHLPEGLKVEVFVGAASPEESFLRDAAPSGPRDLPDDLAANHDYYLHGLRKQQPRRGRWVRATTPKQEMTGPEAVAYTEQLIRLAADTRHLPPDLSSNHDHYLHGLPKQ